MYNANPPSLEDTTVFTYQCTCVFAAAGVAVMMSGASARPPTVMAEAVRATTRERSFKGPLSDSVYPKCSKRDRV